MEEAHPDPQPRGSLGSAVRTGLVIFVVLLAVLALVAWLAGDVVLPMEYEGFD